MQAKADDDTAKLRTWLQVVRTYQKCHQTLTRKLAPLDLSVAQHEVLVRVSLDSGLSQQSLARRLLVAKSNITGLLSRLEARGLLERRTDPDDARTKRVFLTPAGEALVTESFAIQKTLVHDMVATLEPDQLEALDLIMRRVQGQLDELLQDA